MENRSFMQQAINLAFEKMNDYEGGPFGALIVKGGEVVGRGWNRVTSTNDPTAHAEITAIRDACKNIGNFSLEGCALYVNCEPCPMCLAAAYWAGIKTIYYAATRKDAAAIGFADDHIYDEFSRPVNQRAIPMVQMMRDENIPVFNAWDKLEGKINY
ncbi:MAG: nucleoside deaminase [Desulfobulbaceae bacterium]|nr:nucleoside deaminase [Desulfobulbaceae bacterium]